MLKFRQAAICICFVVLLFSTTARAEMSTAGWNCSKSAHFIVYYKNTPENYITGLIYKAESYYETITSELGFTRYEGFWTWDNRARIYLFENRKEYLNASRQPDWAGANANVVTREIYAYVDMENFTERILPHELGHIIFREFIGHRRRLPLWVDEGIVSFLEKDLKKERLSIAREAIKTRAFLELHELGNAGMGNMPDPGLFYAEAASIFEFLFKAYGQDTFVEFCRDLKQLRSDQGWEEAFLNAYKFKDMEEFSGKWKEFLSE
jgi:hypothetical protein